MEGGLHRQFWRMFLHCSILDTTLPPFSCSECSPKDTISMMVKKHQKSYVILNNAGTCTCDIYIANQVTSFQFLQKLITLSGDYRCGLNKFKEGNTSLTPRKYWEQKKALLFIHTPINFFIFFLQTHLNMRCKLLVQQVLTIFLLIYTFHQYNVPINLFCNLFTYYSNYGISLISFYIHNVPPCNFWLPGACMCSQSCDRCWQVSLGTAEILPAPLELSLSEAVRKIKWVSLMISCIGTTFNFAHCPKFYCILAIQWHHSFEDIIQ